MAKDSPRTQIIAFIFILIFCFDLIEWGSSFVSNSSSPLTHGCGPGIIFQCDLFLISIDFFFLDVELSLSEFSLDF